MNPLFFPLYLDNFYSIRASVGVFVIFVTQHINVTLRRATIKKRRKTAAYKLSFYPTGVKLTNVVYKIQCSS